MAEKSLQQSVPILAGLLAEAVHGEPYGDSAADEKISAVRAWAQQLIKTVTEGKPLVLCRGVSCSSMGADRLHQDLLATLRAAGLDVTVFEEPCLEQCDRGPTLAVDGCSFTCAREEIADDERPWR